MTGPDQDRADPSQPPQEDGGSVGSVAEEAAKLFGAVGAWSREHAQSVSAVAAAAAGAASAGRHTADGPGDGAGDGHLATGSTACTLCPVCRSIDAVRATSPEVRDHLSSAGTSLFAALRGVLDAATANPEPPADPAEPVDWHSAVDAMTDEQTTERP